VQAPRNRDQEKSLSLSSLSGTNNIIMKSSVFLQGGILFLLHGNLRDGPGISPEITLLKKEDNDKKCL
jgi:hypothetical protein